MKPHTHIKDLNASSDQPSLPNQAVGDGEKLETAMQRLLLTDASVEAGDTLLRQADLNMVAFSIGRTIRSMRFIL